MVQLAMNCNRLRFVAHLEIAKACAIGWRMMQTKLEFGNSVCNSRVLMIWFGDFSTRTGLDVSQ